MGAAAARPGAGTQLSSHPLRPGVIPVATRPFDQVADKPGLTQEQLNKIREAHAAFKEKYEAQSSGTEP